MCTQHANVEVGRLFLMLLYVTFHFLYSIYFLFTLQNLIDRCLIYTTASVNCPKSCSLGVGYVLLAGLPCLASMGEDEPGPADLMCQDGGVVVLKGAPTCSEEKGKEKWGKGPWKGVTIRGDVSRM